MGDTSAASNRRRKSDSGGRFSISIGLAVTLGLATLHGISYLVERIVDLVGVLNGLDRRVNSLEQHHLETARRTANCERKVDENDERLHVLEKQR